MTDVLKYKEYSANVHYSSVDDVFFGKVSGIRDLISFEGCSVSELKEAFKGAIEDYLETCKQLNKLPDKTYKGVFNVRVPANLHQSAVQLALKQNITLNDFVKSAISYAINHQSEVGLE